MLRYLCRGIVAVLSGFILSGHAASPDESGYLSDYGRLKPGKYLEAYWIETSQIKKSDTPSILLGEISTGGIKDKKGVSVADCISWLRRDLLEGGAISDNHPDTKYRLNLAITYMNPGSSAKRLWAGEFGAGHAQIQIEGKIVDIENGQLIASFAERRRSSGKIGLEDVGGDSGPKLIEHMIKLISKDLKSELQLSFSE